MVLLGTLLLFGFEPCCKLPGVVVRGTAFGSVGVAGTADGRVVELGVVTLLGTVLDGTVEGCVVELGVVVPGVVVGEGCVTELPGFTAPGRSDGCTVAPGTIFGCVVLLG